MDLVGRSSELWPICKLERSTIFQCPPISIMSNQPKCYFTSVILSSPSFDERYAIISVYHRLQPDVHIDGLTAAVKPTLHN